MIQRINSIDEAFNFYVKDNAFKDFSAYNRLLNFLKAFPITADDFVKFLKLKFPTEVNHENLYDDIDGLFKCQNPKEIVSEEAFLEFLKKIILIYEPPIERYNCDWISTTLLPSFEEHYDRKLDSFVYFINNLEITPEFQKKYEAIIEENLELFTEKFLLKTSSTENGLRDETISILDAHIQLLVPFSDDFIVKHAGMFLPEIVYQSRGFKSISKLSLYFEKCLPIELDIRSQFYRGEPSGITISKEEAQLLALQHNISKE